MKDSKIISKVHFEIPEGRKAEITLNRTTQIPRYLRVGNGVRNTFMGKDHIPRDAIEEITHMSVPELFVIRTLKKYITFEMVETDEGLKQKTSNICIINMKDLSDKDKQKFKEGYKRLHEKDVVRRIKRQHYIFNPDFFIPYLYTKEKRIFDSLS